MQLGVRWRAGEPPHRSVPGALHAVIAEQERGFPDAGSWTLTWLEGLPRCVLDGRVEVRLEASGEVRIIGLAGPASAPTGSPAREPSAAAVASPIGGDDEDDDDWLGGR